ncbi:MAG: universal stress protein [Cyanobacteria bacterium J06621_3]
MFNKILIALDTEESCERLFEKAMMLAQSTASDLILLGVLVPGGDGTLPLLSYPEMTGYPLANVDSAWQLYQERYEAYKAKSLATLCRYLDQAIAAGVQTEIRQEMGDPAEVICKVARAENAELIIVGSHGRRGLDEFLMGSVSSYVMHRAPCSVLVDRQSTVRQLHSKKESVLAAESIER